jgi:hypothetical protein
VGLGLCSLVILFLLAATGVGGRSSWVPRSHVAYARLSPARQAEIDAFEAAGQEGDTRLARVYAVFAVLGFEGWDELDAQVRG